MNKRSVVTGLAAAICGAGLALGKAQPPAQNPITTGQPSGSGTLPVPQIAPPSLVPPLPDPTPRPSVIPAPTPATKPPIPAAAPAPPIAKPAIPAASAVAEAINPPEEKPTYATHVFDTVSPWTARGRRACGSVYIDTPYYWLDANYNISWFKKDHTVPLVTTGPVNAANPGALDDPGTKVLFDGQNLHDQPFFGGRLAAGMWFDECQYLGAEIGYYFLGAQDHDFLSAANGYPGLPGLYVPFSNPLTGTEDTFVVADPANASGIIRINSRTRFQGADGHGLLSVSRGATFRVDGIVGMRWLALDEDITIEENVRQFKIGDFNFPTDVGIYDHFGTRNDFFGADFGLKAHFEHSCWSLDLMGRVALGGTFQQIRGDGFTGVNIPTIPIGIGQGGRLTGPANLGTFTSDSFSWVPELGATLGWQARPWLRFSVGYNWLYWTDVVRPGPQIDRVINPIGVQTRPEFMADIYEPRRPGVAFRESDIWVQSVTFGVQFLY